ncbi:hypothetical protein B0O99DRAFT_637436 [Bisporella sp. PMI_857]|nr:hypothetical protein B0O99DRAFT_637436 [Bisporella sp. PMI_857]
MATEALYEGINRLKQITQENKLTIKFKKQPKPKYYVGDKGDWNFKTGYGSHLTIKEGVVSRVNPGRPFTYNLSDQDGKSVAQGIREDDLELQRDESRSWWLSRNSTDAERYYKRGSRRTWISRLFSYERLRLFWSKHRDMFSLLGVIIYFCVRNPTSWRRINHWLSKYPLAVFLV